MKRDHRRARVSYKQVLGGARCRPESREAREQSLPVPTANHKIDLIADEAPQRAKRDQRREMQVAAVGRHAGQSEDRLALDQGAEKRNGIAVLGDEVRELHWR